MRLSNRALGQRAAGQQWPRRPAALRRPHPAPAGAIGTAGIAAAPGTQQASSPATPSVAGPAIGIGGRPGRSRTARRPAAVDGSTAAAAAAAGAAAHSSGAGSGGGGGDAAELKRKLRAELEGIDRGIFGTTSAKREAVLALVAALEAANPLPQPLEHMERLAGPWRLLYTTITITGVKKTKLGLREFVKLGDFIQTIDTQQHKASNEVGFSVTGLGKFKGRLEIDAAYAPAAPPQSGSRVQITFERAKLSPDALEALFRANYDLLLSIFNPEGWLDVTYVDDEIRIGRDDKGHVFVVERAAQASESGAGGSGGGGSAAE